VLEMAVDIKKLLGGKSLMTTIAVLVMLTGIVIGVIYIIPGLLKETVFLDLEYDRLHITERIDELTEQNADDTEAQIAELQDELDSVSEQLTRVRAEISQPRSIGVALLVAGLSLGGFLLAVGSRSQLIIPLLALNMLVFFNIFRDVSFFAVETAVNNLGYTVISGNFYNIIQKATELVLLAIGMTFVISATKGADISVGATASIAGAVFFKVLLSNDLTLVSLILALCAAAVVSVIVVGGFNSTLVAVFRIQPMVATLIMFTTGRAIAYWINGGTTPTMFNNQWLDYFGRFLPGVPIHTPIITAVICGIVISLVIKFTNLGLYNQSVGINEKSARLNGMNPVRVKYTAFVILGLCVAIAAATSIGRIGLINHETILLGVELDAILAVAIGGNSLGGGKFKIAGSIMGAYVIYGLNETLLNMGVSSTVIQAYKAIVIILLVILGSPVVQEKAGRLWNDVRARFAVSAHKEGMQHGE